MNRNPLTPMSLEEIRNVAPSVFAEAPHESRSAKYAYVPTVSIVEAMAKEGFLPFAAMQSQSRDLSRKEFTKHLIRFRHIDAMRGFNENLGKLFPEVLLINSHDGSSSYRVMSGLFRFVCTNGMILGDKFNDYSIHHKGNITDNVIEASYRVIETSEKVLDAAQEWGNVYLEHQEQLALAASAHYVRFADTEGNIATPVRPEQLLTPRRDEDNKGDLWSVFNRIQENVIKGGLPAQSVDQHGKRRKVSTRAIKGISEDIRLNQALWMLAENMKQLKTA